MFLLVLAKIHKPGTSQKHSAYNNMFLSRIRACQNAPKLKNYFVRDITNALSALTLMVNDVYSEFGSLDYGNKTQGLCMYKQ